MKSSENWTITLLLNSTLQHSARLVNWTQTHTHTIQYWIQPIGPWTNPICTLLINQNFRKTGPIILARVALTECIFLFILTISTICYSRGYPMHNNSVNAMWSEGGYLTLRSCGCWSSSGRRQVCRSPSTTSSAARTGGSASACRNMAYRRRPSRAPASCRVRSASSSAALIAPWACIL